MEHDHWNNTFNPISSRIDMLVDTGQLISEDKVFNNSNDFIHVYSIGAREDNPRRIKC